MSSVPVELRDYSVPIKLSLFLHVAGCRPDGYHLLQIVFQLTDQNDMLHFARRPDRRPVRTTGILGVPTDDDLVIRIMCLLQARTGCTYGVDIVAEKRLPTGGGLGGGSSDTAITLLVLNRLWGLGLPRARLMRIDLRPGADVPFFTFGQNALTEGAGEELTPITLPSVAFVVVRPHVHMPTSVVLSGEGSTRDTPPIITTSFPDQ